MGNGPESSGDGWRYRGRGPIEITGHDLYKLVSDGLKVDFINHPELLEGPIYGTLSAGLYCQKCNSFADANDFDGYCDTVNFGRKTKTVGDSIGFQDRLKYYNLAKTIFST